MRDLPVFLLADLPAHQPVHVDLRFRGEHAHEQRLFRHFEREEPGHAAVRRDVLADVEHETGLAHRRARRDDDEVAGLQAARLAIDVVEAGRHAGDERLVLEQPLDLWKAVTDQRAHRHEAGLDAVFGDGKNRALGLVEDEVGFLIGLVGGAEDLVRREDQVPERRLFLDDLRVVLDVGRSRHPVNERCDVGRAAHLLEVAGALQLLLERHEIDRLAALRQIEHALEDAAMRVAEERLRADHRRRDVEGVVVDEDRAQHRSFRFEIMRKRTLLSGGCCGFGCHYERGCAAFARGATA